MRLFGLIGYPLTHAFSKDYFLRKFKNEGLRDCWYELFPIGQIDELPGLLTKNPNLEGLNVTIPYKTLVMDYLDTIDGEAYEIGAVNAIKITHAPSKVSLKGFNTDAYGFQVSLDPLLTENHKHALVLGTGGASKAITHVLKKKGISYQIVSRQPGPEKITYEDLSKDLVEQAKLIINTTPLGMYPEVDACPPLPYEAIGSQHLFYDLIYNPTTTFFLQKGQKQGAQIKNGLEMLEQQAEKSWEIWQERA